MKVFTILYRWFTARCIYCGNKKERYPMFGGDLCCPTDIVIEQHNCLWYRNSQGCSHRKIFIKHKEAKVQRALGLLSGPKGF